MNKYSNSDPFSKAKKVPTKSKRQKAMLSAVKCGQLPYMEAVDGARLIPKSIVAEFKILSWPDE